MRLDKLELTTPRQKILIFVSQRVGEHPVQTPWSRAFFVILLSGPVLQICNRRQMHYPVQLRNSGAFLLNKAIILFMKANRLFIIWERYNNEAESMTETGNVKSHVDIAYFCNLNNKPASVMTQDSESPGREDNDSKHCIGGLF